MAIRRQSSIDTILRSRRSTGSRLNAPELHRRPERVDHSHEARIYCPSPPPFPKLPVNVALSATLRAISGIQSTMRRPLGRHRRFGLREIDDELGAVGREDVLAHEDRLAVAIGGDPLAAQHRRPDRHAEQTGVVGADEVGADRLRGAAQLDIEQFVERAAARRPGATGWRRASAGHHTVTTANGSPSARLTRFTRSTWSTPSSLRTRSGGDLEGELLDLAFRQLADAFDLRLDRAERLQALAHRLGRRRTSRSPGGRRSDRPRAPVRGLGGS